MSKVIIIYESKYGNTRLAAETIAGSIESASGNAVSLYELKDVVLQELADFDVIIIGSPNHMGGPTGGTKKLINKLGTLNLKGTYAAVFDTYIGKDYEKAVKKMEKQISEKALELSIPVPGLSIRVNGMKGPITEGELPKCSEFGARIASHVIGRTNN